MLIIQYTNSNIDLGQNTQQFIRPSFNGFAEACNSNTTKCTLATACHLSAAFGLLNHKVLHKVISYSIRGIVNRWFENYLFDRIQFGEISRGVPQNSILEQLIYFI